eukprot:3828000-Ditylum_brightwellii.AAC.1
MEVQMYQISNKSLYTEFYINLLKNIITSHQLQWQGKIALMEESRLPKKCISAWHSNLQPIGQPQTTIHHTCICVLCMIGVITPTDQQGCLAIWFPQIILKKYDGTES